MRRIGLSFALLAGAFLLPRVARTFPSAPQPSPGELSAPSITDAPFPVLVPQVSSPNAWVLVARASRGEAPLAEKIITGNALEGELGALEWRTARGEILKTLPVSGAEVGDGPTFALAPEGELLAVQTSPRSPVRWISAWSGAPVREFAGERAPFEFSPDGNRRSGVFAAPVRL